MHILGWLARDGDSASLEVVFVDAVAAPLSREAPPVILDQLNDVSYLHARVGGRD